MIIVARLGLLKNLKPTLVMQATCVYALPYISYHNDVWVEWTTVDRIV